MTRRLRETPSQTAGPYLHIGCLPEVAGVETLQKPVGTKIPKETEGTTIRLEGRIYDGTGEIVRDAMVEAHHGDGAGNAGIWLRSATDFDTGFFRFDTVKPVATAMVPSIDIWIVARGINLGLHTRVYFPDEDNENDPILALAGRRRATLIASRPDEEEDERDVGKPVYRFNIYLQGDRETVFFDV